MMNENFIARVVKILVEQGLSETHEPEGYDTHRDAKKHGASHHSHHDLETWGLQHHHIGDPTIPLSDRQTHETAEDYSARLDRLRRADDEKSGAYRRRSYYRRR